MRMPGIPKSDCPARLGPCIQRRNGPLQNALRPLSGVPPRAIDDRSGGVCAKAHLEEPTVARRLARHRKSRQEKAPQPRLPRRGSAGSNLGQRRRAFRRGEESGHGCIDAGKLNQQENAE